MTHKELIDHLGGASALAVTLSELLECSEGKQISRSRVAMWRSRNRIPGEFRHVVEFAAQRAGVNLPAGFANPLIG